MTRDRANEQARSGVAVVQKAVGELRARLSQARQDGATVGLVPTMGALHAGHLSLIGRAAAECDEVVVSIFVNPIQFDDPADLAAYPRDLDADNALAGQAGATIVFAPTLSQMYPGDSATTVHVAGVAEPLEGAQRGSGHFDGVATVVTKLLNLAAPDVAYFGQKDAQQVAVVKRVVADLNLPVRIEVVPTVREPDGLALSSRNARLNPADRDRASALHAALATAKQAWATGERRAEHLLTPAHRLLTQHGIEPEYLALVDPDTFRPVTSQVQRPALLAVAARFGDVRLIDNELLESERSNS